MFSFTKSISNLKFKLKYQTFKHCFMHGLEQPNSKEEENFCYATYPFYDEKRRGEMLGVRSNLDDRLQNYCCYKVTNKAEIFLNI